jgi:hypothetical protein
MSIIEHGDWIRYSPATRPPEAPGNAKFAQRVSDAQDWYDYVNPPATNFQTGSVKMTVYRPGRGGPTVGAATFDATMLWPDQMLIVEDTGYAGTDPQTDYGGKIYDTTTQTFSDPPPFDPPAALQTLLDRLAALEAKVGGA